MITSPLAIELTLGVKCRQMWFTLGKHPTLAKRLNLNPRSHSSLEVYATRGVRYNFYSEPSYWSSIFHNLLSYKQIYIKKPQLCVPFADMLTPREELYSRQLDAADRMPSLRRMCIGSYILLPAAVSILPNISSPAVLIKNTNND